MPSSAAGPKPLPFLARLDTLLWAREGYAIWRGYVYPPFPLTGEAVLLGSGLNPGPEGYFRGLGRVERHPKWGERVRVLQGEGLSLEEVLEEGHLHLGLKELLLLLAEAGHTALPITLLADRLRLSPHALEESLRRGSAPGEVVLKGGRVGLAPFLREEEAILERVKVLLREPGGLLLPPPNHGLTPEQAGIFRLFEGGRIGILSGGPGTGKSFTVSRLLASPSLPPEEVALAAPTGKAAKRLAQLSGREAFTVHRLLGLKPDGTFTYNASRPLPFRLVVVDEASMLDTPTALALLKAIGPRTLLLLVGDPHQLPPVGRGQPFADLVGRIPTLTLRKVHRQAAENPLVRAAWGVIQGQEPEALPQDPRFTLVLVEEARLMGEVLSRSREADVVLTATNRHPTGVAQLNLRLKEARNPGVLARVGLGLPLGKGDPAIFTRNHYGLGLSNGETGRILGLSSRGELLLDTDREVYAIPQEEFPHLLPAYAISVHRSQGSEWPRVLVVLSARQESLLSRELLYTALTRARERAILVASPEALARARGKKASARFTWLQILE